VRGEPEYEQLLYCSMQNFPGKVLEPGRLTVRMGHTVCIVLYVQY